jgi:hypothetical protein
LAEKTASLMLGFEFDTSEPAAHDAGNFIVTGEAFVQVSVIGGDEVEHATILLHDAGEEHFLKSRIIISVHVGTVKSFVIISQLFLDLLWCVQDFIVFRT